MSVFRKLALGLLVGLVAAADAQDVKVEKYRLPNGMKVILHEDHSLPLATINIWYSVGSKDEQDRRSGFAHLFEHLMFMGTERVPNGQFDKIMEGAGGGNNASTTEDRTNYYSSGPSNLLPTLLWLDAERMESLSKAMTKEKVDLQRDVVKNERRQNTENTPYGKAYESVNALMFPKGHPYSWSVIGSHEDLTAASVQDVQDFFDTYYVPNNASLVVAGDFDPKKIKPLIAKWFGSLPRKNDPPRREVPPINFHGVKRVTMVDQVQFPKTVMVWHSPASYQPGDIRMQLASAVLSNGLDSRLYDRLVVKDQLASEVSTFQESRKLGSLFYVDATANEGVPLDKLEKAIDSVIAEFRRTGPTKAELDRIKAQIEYSNLSGLQSIANKADKLNEYEFAFGNPNSFKRVMDMYRSATPEQVKQTADSVLNPKNRLILRVIPQAEPPKTNPRDAQPAMAKEAKFAPVQPKQFSVSGIKVFYWSRPELPLMSLSTVFTGGALLDPATKAGRTSMMADMLDEGAGSRDAQQFENALEQLGASFNTSAGFRSTTASLSTISSNFAPALSLYADALIRPRFDAKEWDRVKRTTIAGLQQELDDPATVGRQVAMREYFGWSNPYGRPVDGTATTVGAIALNDVKAEYKSVIQPQNATIFVAGSLSEAQVKAALEKAFAGWKGTGGKLAQTAIPATDPKPLRVVLVEKPGAVQTFIRFVLPGYRYADGKRIPAGALGTILGGSFTSRLNQNLREAKGYTYGAGSNYVFEQSLGWFVASSSVRADVTGASISEFLKELKGIKGGDITDQEAEKARSIQRAGVVESMGSLQSMLGTAIGLYLQGRPFSALGEDMTQIAGLKTADLNSLAQEAIDLDRGVLVLVGDKEQILKQIEGLGLPKPEIVLAVK